MRTQIVSLQKMINMRSNEEHDIEINSGGKNQPTRLLTGYLKASMLFGHT